MKNIIEYFFGMILNDNKSYKSKLVDIILVALGIFAILNNVFGWIIWLVSVVILFTKLHYDYITLPSQSNQKS